MTGPSRRFGDNLQRLRAAQKPAFGTGAYARYVNRPAGRLTAAAAHSIGLTPDGATVISAMLSGAGLAVLSLARPNWWIGIAVAALLALGYMMDSVDGQLARLRGGGSVRGEWLDHTVDAVKTGYFHLAVAISWYRFPPVDDRRWLLVPIGFAVVQTVTYFCLILMPFLRTSAGAARPAATGHEHPLRKWAVLLTEYGFVCWVFVLLGAPKAFLAVYTGLFVLSAATLAAALRKWWRELGALDRQRLAAAPAEQPR